MAALFQADIFSISKPQFSQVRPDIGDLVRGVIRTRFASVLPELRAVSQFGGNELNSNNFRLATGGADFLLKRLPGAADAGALARQLSLLGWLHHAGVVVPRVVASDHGDALVAEAGFHWCLFNFVEGDFFAGGERELISTGRGIGLMQHALVDLPDALAPGKKWDYATSADAEIFAAVRDHREQRERVAGEGAGRLLIEQWPRVVALAEELEERRGDVLSAPLGACHADLHPHNILVRDGQLAALVDFEAVIQMPLHASIGYAAYKLVKQHAVREGLADGDAAAIHAAARRFVAAIAEHAPAFADLERLRLMALAELFRRILVVFRLNLVDGNTVWNHVLPMHLAGTAEMEIIFRGSR